MGVHDGSHIIDQINDQYIKKREDINMHNRRIDNLKTICMTDSTSNLNFAINMSCLLNYSYTRLCQTLLWEYYQQANAFYNFPTANSHELTYDPTTRKVSKIFDQSLSQDDAYQSDMAKMPVISDKNNRIKNRYYIEFSGSDRLLSDIDLNPDVGTDDIVNIFIVYKLKSIPIHYWVNGLCGHDNGGYDKFIGLYTNNLIISGTVNNFINIGTGHVNGYQPHAPFKNKANASVLNVWICLSVHWNIASEKSFVYINGVKICDFMSRVSTGSNKLTIGDLNPGGISALDGSIAAFLLYKGSRMEKRDILLHHHVFCSQWFNIDHEPITF